MATTIDFKEIEEVLKESYSGSPFPVADLSSIERCYAERYNKPLDYTSFGVTNIQELLSKLLEQERALLIRNPESKEVCVMSSWAKYSKQPRHLQYIVEKLLRKHGGEIAFSSFEYFYMEMFKRKWNSLDFGVANLDVLCNVLKHIVEVEVNFLGEKVMKVAKTYISGPAPYREIEEILEGAFLAIKFSELSCIERCYELRYHKPLDYTCFGVTNIQELVFNLIKQNKALLLENPESKEKYVMSVSLAKFKQNDYLKSIIEELLCKYGGEIAFSSFDDFYKDKYKLEWNSFDFGLTNLDELCCVFEEIVKVEKNSLGQKVMKAVNKDYSGKAAVTREIEEVLQSYPYGIAMSDLSCIECIYRIRYDKSLDYKSFGVANCEELFRELCQQKKVLVLDRIGSKERHVMSASLTKSMQQSHLKRIVKKMLEKSDGEIKVNSFEVSYKDMSYEKWNSYNFGLTSLDELCNVFNDIVRLEVNSSGEKVIKAVNKGSSGIKSKEDE